MLACGYPNCKYSFAKRNHLERHQRTHTKRKEYTCPLCKRAFSRPDSRDRHVGKFHPQLDLITLRSHCNNEKNAASEKRHHSSINVNDGDALADSDSSEVRSSTDARSSTSTHLPSETRNQSIPPFTTSSPSFISNLLNPQSNFASTSRLPVSVDSPATVPTSAHTTSFGSSASIASASTPHTDLDNLDVEAMISSLLWSTSDASFDESLLWMQSDGQDTQMTSQEEQMTPSSGLLQKDIINLASHSSPLRTSFSFDKDTAPGPFQRRFHNARGRSRLGSLRQRSNDSSAYQQDSVSALDRDRNAHTSSADSRLQKPMSTSAALELGASQIAGQMTKELQNIVGNIKAPSDSERGLATSCFWLCQRYYTPSIGLPLPSKVGEAKLKDHALVMNLIALGSLWHNNKVARDWGGNIWKFALKVVWSRGTRNLDDNANISKLMAILLLEHSYVLMSSDPEIHKLGRRSWLCNNLLRECWFLKQRGIDTSSPYDDGHEEDSEEDLSAGDLKLESLLSSADYRAELEKDPRRLQAVWHRWCNLEEHNRVIWSIYIYDSQHTHWLGIPPSLQASIRRQQTEPAAEKLLEAKSAMSWLKLYKDTIPKRRYLGKILLLFYRPFPTLSNEIEQSPSQLATYVILESIYSSWLLDLEILGATHEYWNQLENRPDQRPSLDLGLIRSLHALAHWRFYCNDAFKDGKQNDRYCLMIRWHAIHLSFSMNNVDLMCYLREQTRELDDGEGHDIVQCPKKIVTHSSTSPEKYFTSSIGRRGLWHAGRIIRSVVELSRVTCTPIHVAQAAFESALLLVSFALYIRSNKVNRDRSSMSSFELLESQQEDQEELWPDLGLAGFLPSSGEISSSDFSLRDWGGLMGSEARNWICQGNGAEATLESLPIQNCILALEVILRTLEETKLMWCLAEDHKRLMKRAMSLMA